MIVIYVETTYPGVSSRPFKISQKKSKRRVCLLWREGRRFFVGCKPCIKHEIIRVPLCSCAQPNRGVLQNKIWKKLQKRKANSTYRTVCCKSQCVVIGDIGMLVGFLLQRNAHRTYVFQKCSEKLMFKNLKLKMRNTTCSFFNTCSISLGWCNTRLLSFFQKIE